MVNWSRHWCRYPHDSPSGWVVSEWEDAGARPPGSGPQRKYYELTGAGRQVLREAEELSAASIAASGGAPSGVARRPEAQA